MTLTATPKTVTSEGLDELFNRVNMLLGDPGASTATSRREPIKTDSFVPQQPRSMRETGINSAMIEKITCALFSSQFS